MYVTASDPSLIQAHLNHDLSAVFNWVTSDGSELMYITKSQSLLMARKHHIKTIIFYYTITKSRAPLSTLAILLDGCVLQPQISVKYLGVLVNSDLILGRSKSSLSAERAWLHCLLLEECVHTFLPRFWSLFIMLLCCLI